MPVEKIAMHTCGCSVGIVYASIYATIYYEAFIIADNTYICINPIFEHMLGSWRESITEACAYLSFSSYCIVILHNRLYAKHYVFI